MKAGRLFGIGVGPGDPGLVTVKAARCLAECAHVFAPKSATGSESAALAIVQRYVRRDAFVHELVFPMTDERKKLEEHWAAAAREVVAVLQSGHDACFITLGDPLLYSTYVYLVRAVKRLQPDARIETVPGVPAFAAAAALTDFPVGVGKRPVVVVPTADDLTAVREALRSGGTVVLMKIGPRLAAILEILEEEGVIKRSVFVARAGHDGQRVETDLRRLRNDPPAAGYLSIILVDASTKEPASASE